MPKRKSRTEKIRDAEKRMEKLNTEYWRADADEQDAAEEARELFEKLNNARARLRRLKGQKDAKGKRPK